MFVYELSGCGFESRCSHLKYRGESKQLENITKFQSILSKVVNFLTVLVYQFPLKDLVTWSIFGNFPFILHTNYLKRKFLLSKKLHFIRIMLKLFTTSKNLSEVLYVLHEGHSRRFEFCIACI